MENKLTETLSFTPKPPEQNRGAGGKFRKPPPSSRRPPSTPYTRPPPNQPQPSGRWLSKLVDPAFRLISGGANLIFPSFFSKSDSGDTLPDNNGDSLLTSAEQINAATGNDVNFTFNQHQESRTTGGAGTSKITDRSISHSDFNEPELNQKYEPSDPNGLSKIEGLLKDNKFSRDEINRLVEILNSRDVDVPKVEQENKCLDGTAGDFKSPAFALEYPGKLSEGKQGDSSRAIWDTSKFKKQKHLRPIAADAGNSSVVLENSRKSVEERHEDLDRVLWKSSTSLPTSKLQDDVGTSPIEIARAYMENRTLEVGFGTNSLMSKDEGSMLRGDELELKPYIPSPAPKSSPYWPGASVQDQRGYMTPQSQGGRFGFHNFPRTPYSRSIYSKTKSRSIQLLGNSDKRSSMISTPFQTPAPSFGQISSRGSTLNDGRGSVGPIRRIPHKGVAETPRGSYFRTSLNGGQVENYSVSEGLFSAPRTNLENAGTNSAAILQTIGSKPQSFEVSVLGSKPQSSEVSVPTVPSHSSQVARKILELLDRNPPTPKDKSAELRLATSWKKPNSSDLATFIPDKLNRLTRSGGFDSSQESANEVNIAVNKNTSTSDMKVGSASTFGDYGRPSLDSRERQDSQLVNPHKDASKVLLDVAGSIVSSSQKLPPQPSSTKPLLPSIAISRPNQRWNFSSDNGLGFTFPVSATSGGSSEPPTPSIIPSSSVIGQLQQNEGSSLQNEGSVPSYSFGSRSSTTPLVFSFPSTGSTIKLDNESDLKFKFGSDETRISFSSVGKNSICY